MIIKQEPTVTNKITEKEQLELAEKKVEIQKKRLEIKKVKLTIEKMIFDKSKEQIEIAEKKVAVRSKQLENKRTILDMEEMRTNRNLESERLLNDKIFSLLFSLMFTVIDEERTILGSEPFYTPIIKGERREIAITKLMDCIKHI